MKHNSISLNACRGEMMSSKDGSAKSIDVVEVKGVERSKGSYPNPTREEFENFSCEEVVRYLRVVQGKFRLREETITAVKDQDLDGKDLLEMTEEQMLKVWKMGPVKRLGRLLSSLSDTQTGIETKSQGNQYDQGHCGESPGTDSAKANSSEEKCKKSKTEQKSNPVQTPLATNLHAAQEMMFDAAPRKLQSFEDEKSAAVSPRSVQAAVEQVPGQLVA
eukprot:jgi/Bigna1/140005/aug1.53_g14713